MRVNMTTIVTQIMEEVEEEMAANKAEIERVRKFAESGPLLTPKSDIGPLLLPKNSGNSNKVNISI